MNAEFDLRGEGPLPEGVVVLEAAAGTGKTHALEGLYLRLVAEEGMLPEQILAATFTRAATAELRQRIHALLVRAHAVLDRGRSEVGDDRLARILAVPCALERIEAALALFDSARIETLHAFCAHLLSENAFEAGGRFESELVAEADEVLLEIAEEYLLRRGSELGPWQPVLSSRPEWTRRELAKLLRIRLARPHLRLVIGQSPRPAQGILQEARAAWRGGARTELAKYVRDCVERRAVVYRDAELEASLDRLDRALGSEAPWQELKLLREFGEEQLKERRRRGVSQPPPPISRLLDELSTAIDDMPGLEIAGFLSWAVDQARRRLAARSLRTFDTLLAEAHAVLHSEHGGEVIRLIRSKLKAALIDEFQDTDDTQWQILQDLFTGPGQRLFLIGDPKQAIYGFRGASVRTYIRATAQACHRGRLDTNFRSTTAMVRALNRLLAAPRAFLDPGITFTPAIPAGTADAAWVLHDSDGLERPPVAWLPVNPASSLLPAVAASIVALLQGGFRFASGRAVSPGDIAVLVRSNREAVEMQALLRAARVPGVLHVQMSLFATREAEDTRVVLEAIREPRAELVRAALATGWFGLGAADIAALREDDGAFGSWLERFALWRTRWREHGVCLVLRSVLAEAGRHAALLREIGGERRLTNYLHLAETLHGADLERARDPDALLHWLEARQEGEDDEDEALQLRLESDASAVQVVTIHKSKGLQYPIVYCPVRQPEQRTPLCLPQITETEILLSRRELEKRETEIRLARTQEEIRLLYVAFTRARSRVVLAVQQETSPRGVQRTTGEVRDFLSPFDSLLAGQPVSPGNLVELGASLHEEAPKLFEVEQSRPPSIWEGSAADVSTTFQPVVRSLPLVPPQPRFAASFTTLMVGGDGLIDRREPDEPSEVAAVEEGAADFLVAFPPGPRAGAAVHAVFERWRPDRKDGEAQSLVRSTLRQHGFEGDPPQVKGLLRLLRLLESRPLGAGGPRWPGEGRAVEAQFLTPFRIASAADLADRIERYWPEAGEAAAARLRRAGVGAVEGFLRGVVDWIGWSGGALHVVDWKTNVLSARGAKAALDAHGYAVQACLYAAALRRFALLRGRGEPRIETRYVFLRCLREDDPECGIVRLDVPEALIRSVLDLCSPP